MTTGRGEVDRDGLPQSPRVAINDLRRRLEQAVQYGSVEEVDHARGRARIRISPATENSPGRVTGWLPWSTGMADSGRQNWNPLQEGAQVMVLSPSGDPAQGSIIPGVYQDAHGSFSGSGDVYGDNFADGARITYDKGSSTYNIAIPAGGNANISVGASSIVITDGQITITSAKVQIDGASLKHNAKEVGDTHGHVSAPAGPPGPPV